MDAMETHAAGAPSKDDCADLPDLPDIRSVMARGTIDEPTYLYSPSVLAATVHRFIEAFPGLVSYAVKANPRPDVLADIHAAGIRTFDVASLGEIERTATHLSSAVLHFDNPVKDSVHVEQSYRIHGVRSYALDDLHEFEKLDRILDGDGEVELSVRFAIPEKTTVYDMSSKFGAMPNAAPSLLQAVARRGYRPSLAFHVGAQCTDPFNYRTYIRHAAEIARSANVTLYRLNVGGGFPDRSGTSGIPDLKEFADVIAGSTKDAFGARQPDLVCEPGRGLVAACTSLVCKVIHRRDNQTIFLNDGAYGGLLELQLIDIDRPTRCWRHGEVIATDPVPTTVFGPTCDSYDKIPKPLALPHDLQAGDHVEFGLLGAYGSASATAFNGFRSDRYITVLDGFFAV